MTEIKVADAPTPAPTNTTPRTSYQPLHCRSTLKIRIGEFLWMLLAGGTQNVTWPLLDRLLRQLYEERDTLSHC
jgi:hypothetical protein